MRNFNDELRKIFLFKTRSDYYLSPKPFDLNRNGKIDPAEAALIMTIIDGVNEEKEQSIPNCGKFNT